MKCKTDGSGVTVVTFKKNFIFSECCKFFYFIISRTIISSRNVFNKMNRSVVEVNLFDDRGKMSFLLDFLILSTEVKYPIPFLTM